MNVIDRMNEGIGRWPQESVWAAPAWRRVGLVTSHEAIDDAAAVRARIDEHLQAPATVGWVETTDALMWLQTGDTCPATATVLNAELAAAVTDDSLHVRHADEGWRVARLREGTIDEFLADEVLLEDGDPKGAPLRYVRYWEIQADGRVQLHGCRFAGRAVLGPKGQA